MELTLSLGSFKCIKVIPRNCNAKLVLGQTSSIHFHWCPGENNSLLSWLQKKNLQTFPGQKHVIGILGWILKPAHWRALSMLLKECPKGCAKPRRTHSDLMQFSLFAGASTLSRLGGWNISTKIPTGEGGAFRKAGSPSNYVLASPVWGCSNWQWNTWEANSERRTQELKQWGTERRSRGQPRWHFHKCHQRAIRGRKRENLGLAGAGQRASGRGRFFGLA